MLGQIFNAKELTQKLKATVQRTGKLGFTAETLEVLNIHQGTHIRIAEDTESKRILWMGVIQEPANDAFPVNKAGTYFYVNGATGIAFPEQIFSDIISNPRLNVLNLSIDPNPQPGYGDVMQGSMYVCDKNDDGTLSGVSTGESIQSGRRYILTADPHENGG